MKYYFPIGFPDAVRRTLPASWFHTILDLSK